MAQAFPSTLRSADLVLESGWGSIRDARPQVHRFGPMVMLSGELWGGALGPANPCFTLPAWATPPWRVAVDIPDFGSAADDGSLNVGTDGVCYITGANGGAASPGLSLGAVVWAVAST